MKRMVIGILALLAMFSLLRDLDSEGQPRQALATVEMGVLEGE